MTMQWDRRQWCGAGLGLVAGAVAPGWASAEADKGKGGDKAADKAGGRLRFGTPERPFSAQSPWNCRPVDPSFASAVIPKDAYFPGIENGKWSTGVFMCSADDKPQRVLPMPNQKGVWDPDAETFVPDVVIPRWPAGVLPATGSDGHADLIDAEAGIIHSFFQLKRIGDDWRAQQYAWTRLDGRGWGNPAHYFQGARAAGVPTMGGLVRSHEIEDGDSVYRHALALSLTFSGLSPSGYIFPATSADRGYDQNKGTVPEGALLMLPPDFDIHSLGDLRLRKIGETLKRYGGYVVDRNYGTPFVVYAEIGSRMPIHPMGGWNANAANDLDRIRQGLRQVQSVKGWLDGHDQPVVLNEPMNLLSMRGDWRVTRGSARLARFDTWRQALAFEDASNAVIAVESNRQMTAVHWAKPKDGQPCRLTARCSGEARIRVELRDKSGRTVADSGELENGKSASFNWPEGFGSVRTTVRANGTGTASADLRVVAGG